MLQNIHQQALLVIKSKWEFLKKWTKYTGMHYLWFCPFVFVHLLANLQLALQQLMKTGEVLLY